MRWNEATEGYTTWLAARRIAPGTIKLYRHYVRQLAFMVDEPAALELRTLERFVAHYATRAGNTQKSARAAVVSFAGWAASHGVIDVDPARGLPSVRVVPGVPRPMPEELTIAALRAAPVDRRRMVLLGRFAGLRIGEISVVQRIDWVAPMLLVHGKGAKEREVPIVHPELVDVLDQLDGWLFPSIQGGHLAAGTVGAYISELFPAGWSAHRLRTAFATHAYRINPDLLALAQVMGHARTETTQRYVRLDDEAALRVVQAAYGDGMPTIGRRVAGAVRAA